MALWNSLILSLVLTMVPSLISGPHVCVLLVLSDHASIPPGLGCFRGDGRCPGLPHTLPLAIKSLVDDVAVVVRYHRFDRISRSGATACEILSIFYKKDMDTFLLKQFPKGHQTAALLIQTQ